MDTVNQLKEWANDDRYIKGIMRHQSKFSAWTILLEITVNYIEPLCYPKESFRELFWSKAVQSMYDYVWNQWDVQCTAVHVYVLLTKIW